MTTTEMPKTPSSTGELCWMNQTGDSKIYWDKDKPIEVAAARSNYEVLTASSYRGFKLNEDGTQGEQLTAFDPAASRIVMVPPLRGG